MSDGSNSIDKVVCAVAGAYCAFGVEVISKCGLELRIEAYVTCLCVPEDVPDVRGVELRLGGRPDARGFGLGVVMRKGGGSGDKKKEKEEGGRRGEAFGGPVSATLG